MNNPTGFVLIHAVARGRVLGVVLAPKGTEHLPREQCAHMWKIQIRIFGTDDPDRDDHSIQAVRYVVDSLFDYCVKEGLAELINRDAAQDA